jgi:chitin disaccharide deacetylase
MNDPAAQHSAIQLIVQSDDFGMCHAANSGAVTAFTQGIVTQASAMVPAPWFSEAAALALEYRIPLGIHCTLTCEWDGLRWPPLTRGASLVGADGTFHRTAEAAHAADEDEIAAEIVAQTERFLDAGLDLVYYDAHMGVPSPDVFARFSERFAAPFLWSIRFASIDMLSVHGLDEETKREWLIEYLGGLTPGLHLLVSHCAVDEPELRALARPDSPVLPWAREYRVSDLAVLTDRGVRQQVGRRGIQLVNIATASFVTP